MLHSQRPTRNQNWRKPVPFYLRPELRKWVWLFLLGTAVSFLSYMAGYHDSLGGM